ncbi:FkbM family methyltransferase [Phenylobacterium sp.]|uniref:FkbM family methyltransferase n=1 Tax=Phenylobacterium sp. TaxID=1871053 RepID=UPI003BAB2F71
MTYLPETPRETVVGVARYVALRMRSPKRIQYHGVTIPVGADGPLHALRRKLYRGLHERCEIAAVEALLRAEDVVLEIGAGSGVLSTVIAKRLARATLHTFEANPSLIPSIHRLLAQNGLTADVRQAAVGAEDGTATFFVREAFGSSSLVDRGGAKEITVEMVAFGRILADLQPTFVMMDVEGAEREILAKPLPAHVRVLCAEIHPHVIGDEAASEIVRSLLAQGFILKIDASGERVLAFERS